MLKQIGHCSDKAGVAVKIKDAVYPAPFRSGLEYTPPARGAWNIVHTNMLVPESHQIYVCAAGCLRGVILTAAEMGAMDRFSSIVVEERNLIDGSMERLIVDGVGDILTRLPKRPRLIFLYTACIHHFMGCDMTSVFKILRNRYPDVGFGECCMDPIMRKGKLPPEVRTRWRIYDFLQPMKHDIKSVNIIGNNLPTTEDSELVKLIRGNGFTLRDLTYCHTYKEYLDMSRSFLNVSYNPKAMYGAAQLEKRLGQKNLYIPLSFDYSEIMHGLYTLADCLEIDRPDYSATVAQCERNMDTTREIIGDTPVAIDYAATFRPFSLARLLLEHGFNVTRVYADVIPAEDKDDFEYLMVHYPALSLYPTVHVRMRVLDRHTGEKCLAVGQKAAYFTGTRNFVDIAECGGFYGFSGINHILALMTEAYLSEKDAKDYIQIKGWGCHICG